jgi:hypothetical protein
MSNFYKTIRHPRTGKLEEATFVDCHGSQGRYYMVTFPDGYCCKESDLKKDNPVDELMNIFGEFKRP